MQITDLASLKFIGFSGLALFVIDRLFKVVVTLVQQRKNGHVPEGEAKEQSRVKINNTNRIASKIEEPFFALKGSVEDIHEVVSCKKNGVPLIYNTGLEKAVVNLNTALGVQTEAIKLLVNSRK